MAQNVGRPNLIMVVCLIAATLLIWAIPLLGASLLMFVAIGLLFGPPGSLIMVLPVEGVGPENRAVGMGVYFTCYYIGMTLAPPLAGFVRDWSGEPAAPLVFAGATLVLALASLFAFRTVQRSQ